MKTTAEAIKALKNSISIIDERLEKFQQDFAKNPTYALEWSQQTFKDAAAQRVFNKVLALLENDEVDGVDGVVIELKSDIIFMASHITNKSTSATSNLLDEAKLEATVEALKILSARSY